MTDETAFFKRCSVCKDPIGFDAPYFSCSVSTCNKKRFTLVFCSPSCWESHQADARHRDAGAVPARSPSAAEWARERAEEAAKARVERAPAAPAAMKKVVGAASLDALVVGSRLKEYVQGRAGMSTSDRVLGVLSDHLRELCDEAIRAAAADGRRTVLDRDVAPLVARGAASLATGASDPDDRPDEVAVVVSKLKQYVKARSGMNTSDSIAPLLSAHVRRVARRAIRHAATDDRKTVLDRDVVAALSR